MSTLTIVPARSASECHDLAGVFNRIWSAPEGTSVVDLGCLVAMANSGNYVALARVDGRIVGGAAGFFGPPGEPFHSHIAGVLREAGQGVGLAVKLHQRGWCLDHGTTRMHWTYDPLVARNAYFNIHKLGAGVEFYHPDFYGPMQDGINGGQFSDRILMEWDLTREPGGLPPSPAHGIPNAFVTLHGDVPHPAEPRFPSADHAGPVIVGVPRDIESLRQEDPITAREWRLAVRTAFTGLLEDGWRVRDFTRSGQYVFGREPS